MKRLKPLLLLFFAAFMVCVSVDDSQAQLNRRNVKKNNRKMRSFKGKNNVFGAGRKYNYVGVSANALNYFGDLTPLSTWYSTDLSFTRPAVGLTFGHRFGPFYQLRGQFTYGTLKGDDFESADPTGDLSKYRYVRNLHFRNRIKELSVTGVFDLFKNQNTYISRVKWTPYAYVGIAVFHHNPQARVNENSSLPEAGQWVDLQPLGTEGQFSTLADSSSNFGIKPYNKFQISIPMGIGMRYKVTDLIDVSFETGIRFLFTDYIDDVSANYVDLDRLNSDLAREMSDRSQETSAAVSGSDRGMDQYVNPVAGPLIAAPGGYLTYGGYGRDSPSNTRGFRQNNDMYFVTTLRVTYILGKTYKKAKFR